MKRILASFSLVLLASLGLPAFADAKAERDAAVADRLNEVRERLALTDEQVEQMAPVMEASMAKRRSIMARYGIDPQSGPARRPGFRQARAMRGELNAVQADTLDSLAGILDNAQLEEFKRMQEEMRAQMRERMRSRSS